MHNLRVRKKGHALENYPAPTPLPLQKKNDDQSLVSTWKEDDAPASTRSLSPIHMLVLINLPIKLFFDVLDIVTRVAFFSRHVFRAQSQVTASRTYK